VAYDIDGNLNVEPGYSSDPGLLHEKRTSNLFIFLAILIALDSLFFLDSILKESVLNRKYIEKFKSLQH